MCCLGKSWVRFPDPPSAWELPVYGPKRDAGEGWQLSTSFAGIPASGLCQSRQDGSCLLGCCTSYCRRPRLYLASATNCSCGGSTHKGPAWAGEGEPLGISHTNLLHWYCASSRNRSRGRCRALWPSRKPGKTCALVTSRSRFGEESIECSVVEAFNLQHLLSEWGTPLEVAFFSFVGQFSCGHLTQDRCITVQCGIWLNVSSSCFIAFILASFWKFVWPQKWFLGVKWVSGSCQSNYFKMLLVLK